MPDSPRTTAQALEYAQHQHDHATEDWSGMCQRFVRSCYGIPPLFASAWAQWLGADDEDRHKGGDPRNAPTGSALCYKGTGTFGHIMLAARDAYGAWSNDLKRDGEIDFVARLAPTSQWGQGYLGYLTAVNDYDLRLPVPKPKETKRYRAVEKAIERIKVARKNARERGDHADVAALGVELDHLHDLYDALRHA